MKTVLIIGCLFMSIVGKVQNPFITKANVMMQFDVSPNKQRLCCSWWGADGVSKIRSAIVTRKRYYSGTDENLRNCLVLTTEKSKECDERAE